MRGQMNIIILAGGSGTRLWPLSREKYPKQFLKLLDKKSLIQSTALRVGDNPVHVIANESSSFIIESQLKEVLKNFSSKNIITEPVGRNTAPAIAYASSFFADEDIIAVLPSDHFIKNEKLFQKLLKKAEKLAGEGRIVTFGIVPTKPDTGYGYIKIKEDKIDEAFYVDSFKEKPDLETAEKYLEAGDYFWNSGMFVFSVKTLKEELEKTAPDIHKLMLEYAGRKVGSKDFMKFESISIDYAVMEKTEKIVLLKADIGWNDIGGFQALAETLPKDKDGNAIKGEIDFYNINSKDNLIFSTEKKKLIATLSVENLVVVETEDVLMIADKNQSSKAKEFVERLRKEDREECQLHKKVFRPWGYYTSVLKQKGYHIKEIFVYPGKRLSLQSHKYRSENWTIVSGESLIQLEDQIFKKEVGDSVFIPKNTKHRLSNPSKDKIATIVEVQLGDYVGEDDIIRYDDDYGRITE